MIKSNEIKNKIQELNPTLTDEMLDLIYKYVGSRHNEHNTSTAEELHSDISNTCISKRTGLKTMNEITIVDLSWEV